MDNTQRIQTEYKTAQTNERKARKHFERTGSGADWHRWNSALIRLDRASVAAGR